MSQSVNLLDHFVVGLGNPGLDGTVHNVGSFFIDELSKIYGGEYFSVSSLFSSSFFFGAISFRVLKPASEMNISGKVVLKALCKKMYFRSGFSAPFLLVVAEDVDLDPGMARIRFGKSARGHNGVKSVSRELGSLLFSVLWIGVGRPLGGQDLSEYVLSRIPENEKEKIAVGIRKGLLLFQKWLCSGKEV